MCETGDIYIPPGLQHGRPLFYAADNIDFSEDTHDGKNTLHATVMVAFQQEEEGLLNTSTLTISTKASSRSLKGYKGITLQESGICGVAMPTGRGMMMMHDGRDGGGVAVGFGEGYEVCTPSEAS